MKIHKRTILVLVIISIGLFMVIILGNYKLCLPFEEYLKNLMPGVFVGQREFIINLLMGILGSVIVSVIIEIVNYNIAKKNCLISFLQYADELNILYKNVTQSFQITKSKVSTERDMYRAVLDYNLRELYNSYSDIDFILKKNKYSILLEEIYVKLAEIKYGVNSMRKEILFDNDDIFEKARKPILRKYFYEIRRVEVNQRVVGQQVFHDQEISNKLLVIENYLFKCVWYKVIPPYDFIDKMCKMRRIGVLFEKISMFVLFFNVIKWSPIIREGYVNVYNHPDFIEYKKIPFTKYKVSAQ